MKKAAAIVTGLSLLALGARADEATKADTDKAETTVTHHKNHDKKVMKHKKGDVTDTKTEEHDVSKNITGGTTETKEMKADHDAPGMNADHKMDSKETIKRDDKGNVEKHEKTEEAK